MYLLDILVHFIYLLGNFIVFPLNKCLFVSRPRQWAWLYFLYGKVFALFVILTEIPIQQLMVLTVVANTTTLYVRVRVSHFSK